MIQEQVPAQRPSHCLAIIVLLVILVFAVLYALAQFGANIATQTSIQGQCLNNGQSFNNKQQAFTLAQAAVQYRAAHPFGGNYGLGSYTICYKDGTASRKQSIVYPGFSQKAPSYNSTHSEQLVYKWLQDELAALSINQSQVIAIYAVIFSQVIVCPPCQGNMTMWQRTLRGKAKTERVYLSIWQLIPGNGGFNPTLYKAGTGTPVTINMIQEVEIKFVS